ncbi:TetR/AcrR family transcriptional regulator [Staphylococcus arlettae]|uniref:TetR/AcrR family transcriptional regulator n=1 Tax=Staphylococcus arlettae TaxID=29378 RepID=UPI000E690382|nr:TetR/AcrR family transcriptional regulator [Staphylococcus arlettae]RIM78559.1 TetR/AcrR family transcriptional regulator [Staphylococcus arlettae]
MAEDRRVRKTRTAIKSAFIDLLRHKDLDKITVRDITTAADVNRGTFYLHYEDKYILLSDMENEYFAQLSSTLLTTDDFYVGMDVTEFARVFTEKKLKKVIYHINDNAKFYQTLFRLERRSQLEEKISQLMYHNMSTNLAPNGNIDGIPVDYFHSYVVGALLSFIKYWVQDDMRMPPNELVDNLFKMVFNGPLRLMAKEQFKIDGI